MLFLEGGDGFGAALLQRPVARVFDLLLHTAQDPTGPSYGGMMTLLGL